MYSTHNKKKIDATYGLYAGLELSDKVTNGHNGTVDNQKYFECVDGKGILIEIARIDRKIEPKELLEKVAMLNRNVKTYQSTISRLRTKHETLNQTLNHLNHALEKV